MCTDVSMLKKQACHTAWNEKLDVVPCTHAAHAASVARPVINAEPPGEMGPTSSCFCLSNLITMTGAGLRIGRFSPHDRLPLPLLLKRCIWIVFEIHLLGTSVSFIDSSSAVSLPCSQRESGFGHFVWINWCIWLNNSLTEELKLDWTGLTSQSWLVNSKSW